MRRTKAAVVLFISLCLNPILVVVAIRMGREPVGGSSSGEITNAGATVAGTQAFVVHVPVKTFVTNRFDWRQIASTNFAEYVANLRAIGCPEKTIRNIMVPAICKHYRSRELALRQGRSFWLAGKQRRTADRERARQLVALEKERAALLRQLTGNGGVPTSNDFEFNADMQAVNEDAFNDEVRRLLGEERFTEFQRARDSDFRDLVNFTENQSLPVEAAIVMYDLRRAAVDEAARIRNDESLDAAARQRQLEELHSRSRQAALDALGTHAYQSYLAGNGRWLTNGIPR